jgi:hypothetical protein
MEWPNFLRSQTEQTVIYKYLAMLAERTAELERRLAHREANDAKGRPEEGRMHPAEAPKANTVAQSNARTAIGFEQFSTDAILDLLPIIYHDFWNSVGENDLTLVASRLGISAIPKRGHVPSQREVQAGMQQLQRASRMDVSKLVSLCGYLPARLRIRDEMDLVSLEFSVLRNRS